MGDRCVVNAAKFRARCNVGPDPKAGCLPDFVARKLVRKILERGDLPPGIESRLCLGVPFSFVWADPIGFKLGQLFIDVDGDLVGELIVKMSHEIDMFVFEIVDCKVTCEP